jgi:Type I restriction enzyme R protein N terminus (HSDR_N)
MTATNDEGMFREARIRNILDQELQDGEDLANDARKMIAYLLREKKGYSPGEVRKGLAFEVKLGKETVWSSADFIVSVEGRMGMIIKCAAGSLDSRERQAVAAARVIASPPVPVAVIADPVTAEVLEVASGNVIGEGFGAIPTKEQLREILSGKMPQSLDARRLEREKRILLAFDAIKCCVPQGGDGGVQIEPELGEDKKSRR